MTILGLFGILLVVVIIVVGSIFLFGNSKDNDDKHKID